MTREDIVAAMADAIHDAIDNRFERAEAALDAALPLLLRCVAEHGLAAAFDVAAGRDPRRQTGQLALRGLGAD